MAPGHVNETLYTCFIFDKFKLSIFHFAETEKQTVPQESTTQDLSYP